MRLVFCTFPIVRLLVGVLLCQGLVPGADTTFQEPAITTESSSANLTIIIPNDPRANAAAYITIQHDNERNQNITPVVYLMNERPRITDLYASRLSVTCDGKHVTMLLSNVTAADAGTFICFPAGSINLIPDCGQQLVVVRKPNPPIVRVMPSFGVAVGSDLHLVCHTNSTSLPASHTLTPEVFWFDQSNTTIDTSSTDRRVHVNSRSELVIKDLRKADKQLKFYCTSADNTRGAVTKIISDRSNIFAVAPETKPESEDLRLTPALNSKKVVIGGQVNYRCDADCHPQCNIIWFYKPYGGVARISAIPNMIDKKNLTFVMSRITEGLYLCKAENKHGAVNISFNLEALYISSPTTFVNKQQGSSLRLLEDTPVDLSCVFDSNPGPLVTWWSPSMVRLSTQQATGPTEKVTNNGVCERLYTSSQSLTLLKCEDSGLYTCHGRNNVSVGQSKIQLTVMCPPSSACIPGLELLTEYVWDIPQVLTISFVIKAVPEPDITRIFSRIGGQSRKEEIPRDFVISQTKVYDGKAYLTKFSLTSRRNLDKSDDGRIMAVTIESSEFKKEFMFTIHPRGPPRQVVNLTAWDIDHDSLMLSWTPGFSGGELQTFAVDLHVAGPSHRDNTSQQSKPNTEWTTALTKIPDPQGYKLVTVEVGSLKSSTNYVVKVTSMTRLGSASAEIEISTLGVPSESLGAGAIVGIILLILFILAVGAAIIYCLVYTRKPRNDHPVDEDEPEFENITDTYSEQLQPFQLTDAENKDVDPKTSQHIPGGDDKHVSF